MATWTVNTTLDFAPCYAPMGFTVGDLQDADFKVVTSTRCLLGGSSSDPYMDFRGTGFTYSSTAITGGTVKTLYFGMGNSRYLTVTGLSHSAKTGSDFVYADDTKGFVKFILSGDDTMSGNSGDDNLSGEAGNDTMYGNAGNDEFKGNAGNDKLYGDTGNDSLSGGSGVDKLYGGTGKDNLDGGTGDDVLRGEDGNDKLYGDTGKDRLYGGDDNDLIKGEDDNDQLFGDSGDDDLRGGDGIDILTGGAGKDKLNGGAGKDKFQYKASSEGGDTIVDFSAADNDKIYFLGTKFNKLAKGALNSKYFVSNTGGFAKDRNDYFTYSKKNDALYFDSNGKASGGRKLIATFSNGVTLKSANIVIV